jgi:hypothetical protein
MKRFLILASIALAGTACNNRGGSAYTLTEQEQTTVNLGGREYAERTRAILIGCSGHDSDEDGYVSCTVQPSIGTGASAQSDQEILCGYRARGCKGKT